MTDLREQIAHFIEEVVFKQKWDEFPENHQQDYKQAERILKLIKDAGWAESVSVKVSQEQIKAMAKELGMVELDSDQREQELDDLLESEFDSYTERLLLHPFNMPTLKKIFREGTIKALKEAGFKKVKE